MFRGVGDHPQNSFRILKMTFCTLIILANLFHEIIEINKYEIIVTSFNAPTPPPPPPQSSPSPTTPTHQHHLKNINIQNLNTVMQTLSTKRTLMGKARIVDNLYVGLINFGQRLVYPC